MIQRGSVTEFERLTNRIVGLSPPVLLSCFISDLNPKIRREVQALQPTSLPHATALARLQEDKLNDRQKYSRSSFPSPEPRASAPLNQSQTPRLKTPFIQRTQEDMAYRCEKGLCYNCDEKWNSSHRCKGRVLFFIADFEDPFFPEPSSLEKPPSPTVEPTQSFDPSSLHPHISLHAMAGVPATDTFRLYGVVNHARVTILVDSGSTHNFVQPRVVKFFNLLMEDMMLLRVQMGNGSVLDCRQLCSSTTLLIQNHSFTVTLCVLPLSGVDIVLGVEWLRTLGLIITDYSSFTMQFTHLGQPITLRTDVQSNIEPALAHQVKRMIHTHSTSTLFHLSLLPVSQPEPSIDPVHLISAINKLLLKFSSLFHQPTTLPLPCQHDHHINLIPSANPVNVRPYRYPHFQKIKIEKQVMALLDSSLIQPSRSPFSSLVLLVKKKDGMWRMCVNYRALNSITVRDRFLLPTIEELIDELGRALWFSKLDLRQGFHQILMVDKDVPKAVFRTHHGHYEYLVMPFGLCNTSLTFQATMNAVLNPFLR